MIPTTDTLILENTTPRHVAAWLENHFDPPDAERYTVDSLHEIAYSAAFTQLHGGVSLVAGGTIHMPGLEDPMVIAAKGLPMIRFDVLALTDTRVKVLATIGWPPGLEGYVAKTLSHLARDYGQGGTEPTKARPSWLPTTEKTRKKWRAAWKHIQARQKEQQENYADGYCDHPELSLQDYADHIASEMHIKNPCTKWVGHVKRAGEAGLLDD